MKRYLLMTLGMTLATVAFSQAVTPILNDKLASSGAIAQTAATLTADVVINPNPVTGETFSLQLQNLEKGKYNIYIHNKDGKKFLVKTLVFDGGSSIEPIALPGQVQRGTYILQVLSKTARFSKKMVIE